MKENAIIQVENLQKTYPNGTKAVQGITLDIREGEIFSLLGPNGAGKSTMINMMVGPLEPSSGSVTICNDKIKARSKIIKEKVGLVPQEINLWDYLTVEENLFFLAKIYAMPKSLAQERVNSLIETIHLGSHRKQLAKNLSGGLKRRLQVIMGLVHDPEIVMFDEPTPGLDPQSRPLVLDYIQALAKKEHKTILLTTHFIDESERISDRVAIIDHGKLLVLSTVDALKESMGEGDALELNIEPIEKVEDARKIISSTIDSSIVSSGNLLILRSPGLIQRIPDILTNLERAGATVANMKVRKTSLEDVFISLTGRQLRD